MPRTNDASKAAISVSEMAARCQLSRGRFHELVRDGVMPWPIYDLRTRRPLYDRELQAVCLAVRESNIGIDGRYVVFYAQRSPERPRRRQTSGRAQPTVGPTQVPSDVLDGLRSLGMASVSPSQVADALRACFPSGHGGIDDGERLRAVWQYLRRTNGG